jgi:hypothetical protein
MPEFANAFAQASRRRGQLLPARGEMERESPLAAQAVPRCVTATHWIEKAIDFKADFPAFGVLSQIG